MAKTTSWSHRVAQRIADAHANRRKTDEQKHTRPSMKRSSFLRLCVRVCVVKIATAELRSCALG